MTILNNFKEKIIKYENHLSSAALIGGFIFDIFVLKRIDMPTENLWIISHLIVAMLGILLLNFYENSKLKEKKFLLSLKYWLVIFIQFAFGGLLSTFLVFYFRSATLVASWPFLFLLLIAFSANEILKQHYSRLTFQISYLFLSTFAFLIYYLPIVVGRFGSEIFILSGLSSLLVVLVFLLVLSLVSKEEFIRSRRPLRYSLAGTYLLFNILYFSGIIPPIPLSLKDSGVFYDIKRNSEGNYVVLLEKKTRGDYFRIYDRFIMKEAGPVYVYSAIFSPTDLDINIIHEWQYFDEEKEEWITSNNILLSVYGGREGGYRTYSMKSVVFPGFWRVNVKTDTGQLIGRERFEIIKDGYVSNIISDVKK